MDSLVSLKIKAAFRDPFVALGYLSSILKGFYYKIIYAYKGKRIQIGKNFKVRGPLKINGPGKVIIGDNVTIDGRGHPVTPFTHHRNAILSIGSNSFINGTRFGCSQKIEIGD